MKPFEAVSAIFSGPEVVLRKLAFCTLTTLLLQYCAGALVLGADAGRRSECGRRLSPLRFACLK